MLVPGLKRNFLSTSAAVEKGAKTIIERRGSFLDVVNFGVQLTLLDDMEYLDLTITKESRRTESALCAISGKNLGKESVVKTLVSKKPVAQSVRSINVDQRVVENLLVEDKDIFFTYCTKIHNTNEDVSFCEKIEGNTFSATINGNGRKGCKASEVNSFDQVRTSSIIYNTKGCISSEGLNNLYDKIRNLQSKGSYLDSSSDEIKSGSRVISDVSMMSSEETVHTYNKMTLQSGRKVLGI